ncbi:MAG: hypothetical protein OQK12_01925 [Motiliproteus sp.]|nr:hypothetical protein [Motiliproteus sp.]MCW9054040.1 hypothetical protein [Motiliproteus sp.]
MQEMQSDNKRRTLPVGWGMIVLTLVIGVAILVPLYMLYNAGYISTNLTIWITCAVFIFAAVYESYLFYVLTKTMLNRMDRD